MFADFFIFLAALPFSVWLLANFLSVMDSRPLVVPLIRLLLALLGLALFLTMTHRSYLIPIFIAFLCVTSLHAVSGWWLRRSLGVPSYSSEAANVSTPPELEEDETGEELHLERPQ